jgi:2-phospho-L-lactate/phosphoenolpyruvate guanylyltransferase
MPDAPGSRARFCRWFAAADRIARRYDGDVEPTARADLSRTWALVPIRGLETAKTRLGGGLDAEERRDLVVDLLGRTLVATRDSRGIAGTIVVTMDPEAAGIARDHRAIGLVERAPGLNGAILAARSVAVARGATAVLVLPADLPAVSADAIDDLLQGAVHAGIDGSEPAPGLVAVVTDQHGSGTNALLVSPPALIDPAFGQGSRALHRAAAATAGAILLDVDGPLSLDVDTPDDLAVAEAVLGLIGG